MLLEVEENEEGDGHEEQGEAPTRQRYDVNSVAKL